MTIMYIQKFIVVSKGTHKSSLKHSLQNRDPLVFQKNSCYISQKTWVLFGWMLMHMRNNL